MLIFDLHYQDLHYINMRHFTSYSKITTFSTQKILNDLRCEIGKIELTKLLRTSWLMALGLYTVRRNADYGEGKRRLDFRTLEYTGAFVEFGSTPGTQSTPEQSTTDFKVTSPEVPRKVCCSATTAVTPLPPLRGVVVNDLQLIDSIIFPSGNDCAPKLLWYNVDKCPFLIL